MRPKHPPEGVKRPDPQPPSPPSGFGPRWRWLLPNGSHCDFSSEVFVRAMAKASPGSRVVELAPVDPLERAVVHAAVELARSRRATTRPTPEYFSRHAQLRAVIDAQRGEKGEAKP